MRAGRSSPAKYAGLVILCALGFAPAQSIPPKALPVSSGDTASNSGDIDSGSSFDNLEIADPTLKGKLGVLRVGSQLADNNLLAVFAGFKNKTGHRLSLEIMTIYKDKDGNDLNASSWIPVTIPANEEKDYRSSSITEQAVDFLIRVRRASASHK